MTKKKEYTEEQLALKAYIEKGNQKLKEEAEAAGQSVMFTAQEDIDHWISMDINNIAQYEHAAAAGNHSDIYKDIYGSKPRWMPYEHMTTEEIQEDIDRIVALDKEMNLSPEEQAERRKQALAAQPEVGNKAFKDLGKIWGRASEGPGV